MRVPYSWLMEYLKVEIEPDELAKELTMGGLEVEEIKDFTSADGKFTDKVLVTSATSNRGDLLSIVGVARHAAAILGGQWQMPEIDMSILGEVVSGGAESQNIQMKIELQDATACPRYSALVVEDVTIGDSPDWMAYRLEAAGMRPIANVVDCTNYVMLELGQPLHGFDYKLLQKGNVIVRKATDGEQIMTLDGQWRTLSTEDLLIADPVGGAAIAGVMGGADTEMTEKTTSILFESAHFDATTIRKTSMRLGLSSEASYRFERIVDPNGTLRALARVAELLNQAGGCKVIGDAVDACASDFTPIEVPLRVRKCNAVLGTDLTGEQITAYLTALGFDVVADGEGAYTVTVPTFRPDVEREIDLIEEVAIVYGYNNIPTTVPGKLSQSGRLTPPQQYERDARQALRAAGLNETLSFAMIAPKDLDRMGYPEDAPERKMLPLLSPMIAEQSHMRSTLMPSLMQAAEHNQRQRVGSVGLYEIANIFTPQGAQELPVEILHAAGIMMGQYWSSAWNMPAAQAEPDFYTMKGIVEHLVDTLGVVGISYRAEAHPSFHPGQSAAVILDGAKIGVIGKLSPQVQEEYDLEQPAYLFEIDLAAMRAKSVEYRTYERLPRFPAALRDIAVVVEKSPEKTAEALREAIVEVGGEHLVNVSVFDVFENARALGEGKRSIAFSLEFRTDEGTMQDEEVDAAMERITANLKAKTGAELRS